MKNILTFLFIVTAGVLYAASTCETRVDSHQQATTRQRVAYCLTEEPPAAPTAGPELVYSGVYSKDPLPETTQKATVKNGYFKDAKMSVHHQYVGSQNFPAFKNDTLSEQERAVLEQAYLKELEANRQIADNSLKKANTERAPARLSQPVHETMSSAPLTQAQIARGLKARQRKPGRMMKEVAPEPAEPETANPVDPVIQEPVVSNDPLLSPTDNEDELLSDELGIAPEDANMAPIPAPLN